MNLFDIILPLLIAGISLFVINRFIPLEARIKNIINWVVIGFVIIWLLKISGILGYLKNINF